MYELPELEVIRAFVAEKFSGATITKVQTSAKTIVGKKTAFCDELITASVWYVERRAGHLIFHLDTGKRLVIYLDAQSNVYTGEAGEKAPTGQDLLLYMGDRFVAFSKLPEQSVQLTTVRDVEEQLRHFSYDPLDKRFTKAYFVQHMKKKRTSLKTVLVDGSLINGVGSVYSDEILYEAGLHPARKANTLSEEELEQLYHAIGTIIKDAIAYGGVRSNPLFAQDLLTGGYADHLSVHGKLSEDIADEAEPVELITVAKNKCYIAPLRQKL